MIKKQNKKLKKVCIKIFFVVICIGLVFLFFYINTPHKPSFTIYENVCRNETKEFEVCEQREVDGMYFYDGKIPYNGGELKCITALDVEKSCYIDESENNNQTCLLLEESQRIGKLTPKCLTTSWLDENCECYTEDGKKIIWDIDERENFLDCGRDFDGAKEVCADKTRTDVCSTYSCGDYEVIVNG